MLEVSYRCQIVDFYRGSLTGLNPDLESSDQSDSSILIIGDSFSADPSSYVSVLRKRLPNHRIINASVPGTSLRQHRLILRKRLRQFQPDLLIYQVYLGNDLFEWRHMSGKSGVSWIRRCYWWLSDRIWVTGFINSRLPHVRQALFNDLPTGIDPKLSETFSPGSYSQRSKLMFAAEPDYLENTILCQPPRDQDSKRYIQALNRLIGRSDEKFKVLVLFIPHCIQLGPPYLNRMERIGAKVKYPERLVQHEYPFIQEAKRQLTGPSIEIVNPLPVLRQSDQIGPVYYNNDPHLNSFGHDILGNMLMDFIH